MNDQHTTNREAQRAKRLTARIMRRIYLVAAIRMALNPVFLKALIAVVFFWRSTAYVSYAQVIANSPSMGDIPRNIQFFSDALRHTGTGTAFLFFGMAALATWIAIDFAQRKTHAWF